jgi:hypothetical protein
MGRNIWLPRHNVTPAYVAQPAQGGGGGPGGHGGGGGSGHGGSGGNQGGGGGQGGHQQKGTKYSGAAWHPRYWSMTWMQIIVRRRFATFPGIIQVQPPTKPPKALQVARSIERRVFIRRLTTIEEEAPIPVVPFRSMMLRLAVSLFVAKEIYFPTRRGLYDRILPPIPPKPPKPPVPLYGPLTFAGDFGPGPGAGIRDEEGKPRPRKGWPGWKGGGGWKGWKR